MIPRLSRLAFSAIIKFARGSSLTGLCGARGGTGGRGACGTGGTGGRGACGARGARGVTGSSERNSDLHVRKSFFDSRT